MSSEVNVKHLRINKLTEAQYQAATKSDTELYLTPDTTDQDIADAISAHNSTNTAHSTLFSGKQDKLTAQTAYSAKGSATKVPQITTNNLGQVTGITEVTITQPTVNNASLVIQKNATNVATFTANASANVTCNITVPTKVSDLTNDSGFITGITANNVTTALGYTPYNSSNPSGYTTNTGTVTSVRVQAGTGLSSSTSTAQNTTLNTTISIASGYKLPTTTEWSNKQDALPSQSGQSGKFLTTNGSTMSWADASVKIDNSTITKNGSDQIQTVGYKDVRTSNTLKTWTGTRAQYDAIVTKDSNTLYNITDDTDTTAAMLELLYPVGAVYIGTMDVCPLATLGVGSWEQQTSRFLVEKKESTSSDPSWYNLYSDGWCEQGGFITDSGFITFTKPYTNTKFGFSFHRHFPGDSSAGSSSTTGANHNTVARSTQYGSTTGSGAYIAINDENGCDGYIWFACGYTSTTSNIKMWRRVS